LRHSEEAVSKHVNIEEVIADFGRFKINTICRNAGFCVADFDRLK